jgi:hypothetical protein
LIFCGVKDAGRSPPPFVVEVFTASFDVSAIAFDSSRPPLPHCFSSKNKKTTNQVFRWWDRDASAIEIALD